MFDCDFKRDTVRYQHNGNPILLDDSILLLIHRFSDDDLEVERVRIPVTIAPPAYEVTVSGDEVGLARLEVDAVEGAVTPSIGTDFLRFRYRLDGDPAISCLVSYTKSTSIQPFPEVGQLVRGPTNEVVYNHTGDCHDFLFQDFKYMFSGTAASVGVDYVPLVVEVDDGWGPPTREMLYLKVVVRDGELNSAPVLRVNRSHVPVVRQLTSLRLNSEMVSVVDRETDPSYIVINVTNRLDPDEDGFFARTHDHTRPLTSFRYDELVNRKIVFRPASRPLASELEVWAELVAIDSRFAVSRPSTMTLVVRPASSSSALRVLHNRGLLVPEGGSQPITLDRLSFVDAAGRELDDVQLNVKAGLRRGHLVVDGQQTAVFSLRDVKRKKVVYHHDNSDAQDDRIVFRATSGRHSIRVKFPVFVLPRNDRAPTLAAGSGQPLTVQRGGYSQIGQHNLDAVDRENSDRRRTVFHVLDQPTAGEIVKRTNPLTMGRRVLIFTQLDVDRGFVYYRHRGGETDQDRVDYWITDSADPPDRSARLSLEVQITASGNLPPHEMLGSDRWIVVAESSGSVLGRDRLWYEDMEDRSADVVYTVTTQPFHPSDSTTTDAGRLVFLDGRDDPAASYDRFSRAQPLFTFSQTDVNEGRVAYVAPRGDIGPTPRHCRFIFAVTDVHGTAIMDQLFNITVQPVDNQTPRLRAVAAAVSTAGSRAVRLGVDNLVIYDPDTEFTKLLVTVVATPKFGELTRNGEQLRVGDSFPATDFNASDIRWKLCTVLLRQKCTAFDPSCVTEIKLHYDKGGNIFNFTLTINFSTFKNQNAACLAVERQRPIREFYVSSWVIYLYKLRSLFDGTVIDAIARSVQLTTEDTHILAY